MGWIVSLIILSISATVFFQKIQKRETIKVDEFSKDNDDLTEIIQHNKKSVHINLPKKEVHIKRDVLDALFIGQIVFEKYKIEKVIKIGHMSHVYLVKHLILGNYWCLKIVTTYDTTGLYQEEGFLRQMNHQMIPKMIDIFYEENLVYIVEEYIEGQSLEALLNAKGQFNEIQLIKWGIEICEIFEYLHNHYYNPIIYRDLKPENIIVTYNRHLVLIDFGLAKFKTSEKKDFMASGTRLFAPKEQFSDKAITDELTDLYSIGMLLIYLVLENDSEDIITLKGLTRFVSKDFSKLLIKSVNENRDARFKEASHFKKALETLLLKKGIFS